MTFILSVSSGKITLCYGKHTAHELWVERPWDKRITFQFYKQHGFLQNLSQVQDHICLPRPPPHCCTLMTMLRTVKFIAYKYLRTEVDILLSI